MSPERHSDCKGCPLRDNFHGIRHWNAIQWSGTAAGDPLQVPLAAGGVKVEGVVWFGRRPGAMVTGTEKSLALRNLF
jgi:hypothetical protein